MNLPLFFKKDIDSEKALLIFDEETSKYIVQVLRMKPGETIQVTNGLGQLYTAKIVRDHKKNCEASIIASESKAYSSRKICVAISLLKSPSRFEWLLEKTTEIGINEIIPLICMRTEKQHFRYDRMKNICISSMLQSQQVWLPKLYEPILFEKVILNDSYDHKFIAHCIDREKGNLSDVKVNENQSTIILIGPEGDFTNEEIDIAFRHQFAPVSLGKTRLRSETAGVVAAALLTNG